MMEKSWVIKPTQPGDCVERLAKAININSDLSNLLLQRGVSDFEQAKAFFRPSLDALHNPFLMKDMDKAVKRLQAAMANGEKILVFGDYDVDGTTSVALFYDFLTRRYPYTDYYIPDRYTEGYGVSYQGIDWAFEQGFKLIVSLDCGIKSVQHVAYATSKGIDFIICDHHNPGAELPQAVAVLDPKRKDCPYPYKELSGCGVGFKLLQAWCIQTHVPFEELYPYLDLLVVSIASDIVPITGENRILSFYGLRQLNANPRPGLRALLQVAGFKPVQTGAHSPWIYKLNITNVVFGVGPRINAAGRIAHAEAAVELLLATDAEQALQFAEGINLNNDERRTVDSTITTQALEMIANDDFLKDSKSTVLFKNDWHKGVVGIVASRCIEKFYRPTIILTESNNKATGSARSVQGFDVYDAICECADLLEQFGGHTHAAGLTLKIENVEAFRDRFEAVVRAKITDEQCIPKIEVDMKIDLDRISPKFFNIINQMAPFGPENMQPVFVTENVVDSGASRVLAGKNGKGEHLKLSVRQEGSDCVMDGIAFNMATHYDQIKTGNPFHICYTIEENTYMGNTNLQLMIKDIKF